MSVRAQFRDRREGRMENGVKNLIGSEAILKYLQHYLSFITEKDACIENSSLSTTISDYIMTTVTAQKKDVDLEEIYKKYKHIVSFRVKRSLGASNPDWEDIVNEIIVNVIEKVKKGEFRGESSIGTFIYTITSRRIIDYIRQKRKVLKHAPEPITFPAPHKYVEDKERIESIAKAIAQLKPKYKEVLRLYYYKELTREETANKLGITPRRVSERVNYSQKLLKKLIKR